MGLTTRRWGDADRDCMLVSASSVTLSNSPAKIISAACMTSFFAFLSAARACAAVAPCHIEPIPKVEERRPGISAKKVSQEENSQSRVVRRS